MDNTSKLRSVTDREIFYYRQRFTNRLFQLLTAFFEEEAKTRGVTKKDIAQSLRRDPAQISRWLRYPSNLTSDTISDLLLSLGAEIDPVITRFADKGKANQIHPLIDSIERQNPEVRINFRKAFEPKPGETGVVSSTSTTSTTSTEATITQLEDV